MGSRSKGSTAFIIKNKKKTEDITMKPELEIRNKKNEVKRQTAYAQGMVQIMKANKEKAGK